MKKAMGALAVFFALFMMMGTALAAKENGFTTKRYPEDFTDGSYQPRYTISTFSLDRSKTVKQAVADGDIPKADTSRMDVQIPDGLKITDIQKEMGKITVKINMAASDWGKLLMTADPYPYVTIRHSLDRPSAAYETHAGFSGWFENKTLEYCMGLMEKTFHPDSDNTQSSNGIFVGEIMPAQALLIPGESGTSQYLIGWVDKDDSDGEWYFEWYEVVYEIDAKEPFHVPFRYVTEAMLKPSLSAKMPDAGVKVKEITNGNITFLVTDTTKNRNLPIVMAAPDGASTMRILYPSQWSEEIYTVSGGTVTFYVHRWAGAETSDEQFSIGWFDKNGNMIEYGQLMCHSEPEEYAPWSYYEKVWNAALEKYERLWKAPSTDRLILKNGCADIGVTLNYDAKIGLYHIGYDPDAQVTGNLGNVYVAIKAPDNATCFRLNGSGGNNVMGQNSSQSNDQLAYTPAQDLEYVPDDRIIVLRNDAPLRRYQAGPVEVFVQEGEGSVWPYAGGFYTIFWYDDAEKALTNPDDALLIECVAHTTGEMCTTNRIPVVESEEEIKEPVKEVTCVGNDAYKAGWRLVIRRYPYKGSKAFHYELTMENQYGVYQPLNKNLVFYMPYPSDYWSHPEYTFGLRHFSSDYSDYELVKVEETDYGVRFEISSLSPFVLQWWEGDGEMPSDPTPPSGGDNNDDNPGGGNQGNQSGKYHLQNLELRPNYTATVRGVSIRHAMVPSLGQGYFQEGKINFLNLILMEEGSGDDLYNALQNSSITLDAQRVAVMNLEVGPLQHRDWIPRPLIKLQGGAIIGMLTFPDISVFDPAWVSMDADSHIEMVECEIEGQRIQMEYAEFLAVYDAYYGI